MGQCKHSFPHTSVVAVRAGQCSKIGWSSLPGGKTNDIGVDRGCQGDWCFTLP